MALRLPVAGSQAQFSPHVPEIQQRLWPCPCFPSSVVVVVWFASSARSLATRRNFRCSCGATVVARIMTENHARLHSQERATVNERPAHFLSASSFTPAGGALTACQLPQRTLVNQRTPRGWFPRLVHAVHQPATCSPVLVCILVHPNGVSVAKHTAPATCSDVSISGWISWQQLLPLPPSP